MGIVLGLALVALSMIVYRIIANALKRDKPPLWATHWLLADTSTVGVVGLMAVGLGIVIDTVLEHRASEIGAASLISALVVIGAWFVAMRMLRPARARVVIKN